MVCLGTVALDTVETPSGTATEAPGGSGPYFAAAARRWGRVALVGVAGSDLPATVLGPLEEAGVDVGGVCRVKGPTFRWHVRYDGEGARVTVAATRGVSVATPPALELHNRDARALFLGSTDPRVQRAVREDAGRPGLVAMDTMRHWIRDRRQEVEELLSGVHLLLVDRGELASLGGDEDEGRAVRRVRALGVPWVVVKRGGEGARAYGPVGAAQPDAPMEMRTGPDGVGIVLEVPAEPVDRVVDPTGAGDAFAGGLVGVLAAEGVAGPPDAGAMGRALEAGARMGALAVSDFSYRGLMG